MCLCLCVCVLWAQADGLRRGSPNSSLKSIKCRAPAPPTPPLPSSSDAPPPEVLKDNASLQENTSLRENNSAMVDNASLQDTASLHNSSQGVALSVRECSRSPKSACFDLNVVISPTICCTLTVKSTHESPRTTEILVSLQFNGSVKPYGDV